MDGLMLTAMIVAAADSMKVFAGGDKTFVFGEWKRWRDQCHIQGRTLPSEDFKKRHFDA